MILRVVFACLAASLVGCGSKQKPAEDPPLVEAPRSKPRVTSPAVAAYCQELCPRMTQCALEDARAELPPKQVAELEEVAPEHTRVCRESCDGTRPKDAVIAASHRCLEEHATCAPLLDCLDAAEKLQHAPDSAAPTPDAAPAP